MSQFLPETLILQSGWEEAQIKNTHLETATARKRNYDIGIVEI